MCFSAEASFGAAIALLPAGAYCVEAAWRKNRSWLALAVVPLLFGLQQLCEALVWLGLGRTDAQMTRVAALAFLFFALAVWPVWIPLAIAAVEPGKRNRRIFILLAAFGMLFAISLFLPLSLGFGVGADPIVAGHSIRYDLTNIPAVRSIAWHVLLGLYFAAVSIPFLLAQNPFLRPVGGAIVLLAIIAYQVSEYAFTSVWCFFAAILCLYLVRIHSMIPDPSARISAPCLQPSPSN